MKKMYKILTLFVSLILGTYGAAIAQCTYTTTKAGNFNDPTIYSIVGTGCSTLPGSGSNNTINIIINHAVTLTTDYTIGRNTTLTINATGSLVQDNLNRTLAVDGNTATNQNLIIAASTARSAPRLNVAVLNLAKTTVVIGNNSVVAISCTLFTGNQTTINLGNNALLNVFGNVDVSTGNPGINGPVTGTVAGLRISGNIVNNSGGGAKLFTTNGLTTCVQGNAYPSGCGTTSSTSVVNPPTSNDPTCFTVLPVTLTSLSVTAKSTGALISWATATEVNNAYFELERSTNGKLFTAIGKVQGTGTTSTGAKYSYDDTNPLTSLTYYRLRQVDTDGTATFSSVVAVSAANTLQASFYPNPSNSSITLPAADGVVEYRVYSVTGQVLAAGKGAGNSSVTIQQIPEGIYFLELTAGGKRNVQRFVRQ
ncbi:T9SS type A sorting domain-containing protein [Hymenobacter endophyticus]|uniref:T9SS type A sorting domain-containing protein n=1 Tax=Hymenobacter endophyticus TaxID=3076335 RepID=A0ABU3TKL7_9BACT|nr:T9SS type A sorting domain-containing protein [Hymenobacter endophyticus]MDU0371917.1 T9SS type A sorting domain-containing protein [Hymenobacter endophyticus]